MTKVIFDISMSTDGFVTASNVRPEEPMGDGGQRLHEWAFSEHERNRELLAEAVNFVGGTHRGPAHLRSFRSVVGGGWSGGPCSGSGIRRDPCRAWGGARGRRVHFCERWDRERPRAVEGGRRG